MSQSSVLAKKRSGADRYDGRSSRRFGDREEEKQEQAPPSSDSNTPSISAFELDDMDQRLGFPRITQVGVCYQPNVSSIWTYFKLLVWLMFLCAGRTKVRLAF